MNVAIRPAEVGDLAAVSQLLATTWHATYDDVYGPDRVDAITARWHDVATLAEGLDRPDVHFLVADDGQRLLGTASLRIEADGAILDRLYVLPDAQGRGLGSMLLDACLATVPDAPVRLEVEPANLAAVAFYEHKGFRTTGRTDDCGGSGDRIPAIVMTREHRTG